LTCLGAEWVPAEIRNCGECSVTNLHLITPQEGWAVAYDSLGNHFLQTNDGGSPWESQPIDDAQYIRYLRSQFLTPLDGWTVADLYTGTQIALSSHSSLYPEGHNPGAVAGQVRIVIEPYLTPPGIWISYEVIDEGFWGKSPAGIYDQEFSDVSTNPLHGTSVYWDGRKDDTEYPLPDAPPGTYRVRRYVDDIETLGSPQALTIT
jgi:hypothetical protein